MSLVYETCAGLRTTVDPNEINYSSGENVLLRSCSNVDITDANKIRRRDGTLLVHAQTLGMAHSMFAAEEHMVFVEGDALSIRDKAGNVSRLRQVTSGLRMSCVEENGVVYHTNGIEQGRIENGVAYTWVKPAEDDAGPNISTEWMGPPTGHILSSFGPHLLIGVGDYVVASKEFNPYLFNPDELNQPVYSPARMIREVTEGLWVSNQTAIFFYQGNEFSDLRPVMKHSKPAVAGTDVYFDQNEVMTDLPVDQGLIVTAEDAILLLTSTGQAFNLSKKKITIPAGASGTAMIRGGQYLVNINI